MGVSNGGCDDAHSNLEVDWKGNSVNYTCFNPTTPLIPNYGIQSKLHCDNVKNNYFIGKGDQRIPLEKSELEKDLGIYIDEICK